MICKNCIHFKVCKHKSKSVYECEHFADGTVKNHYDRIRNMSVIELAEFIAAQIRRYEQRRLIEINQNITATHIEYVKRLIFMECLQNLESEVTE